MNRRTPTARLLRSLAVGTSLLALGASPAFAEFKLNILHINDPHSRIEPINRFNSTCSAEDDAEGKCFGGFARLKTAIEQRKEALEGPTIVISAGDHFQGSLFYTTYKGEVEAEMAEAIGIELFTLGNHEFDDGQEELNVFLDGVGFPVLGANVQGNAESGIEGKVDPYVIAEFGDEQVAFVGAVASDTAVTSSPGENIEIGDDIAAIRDAVERAKAQGATKIIAVTHIGLEADKALAEAVPDIDLIIGGHSHTLLSNTDEDAAGPYPTIAADTPIVQAGAYSKYLGEIVVTFDDEGKVTAAEGDTILLDASIEEDAALKERIASLAGPIEELKQMVVGEATDALDGDRANCRARECTLGNLIADAMLDRVKDQGAQIAIQNGGGIRASIDAGEVTMGEVLTVLPFQNTLATFDLKGADIVESLENGVGQIEEGAGRFPQVAGMSFAFDPAKPAGERVSDVKVGGELIDPEATYSVVSNNFMRSGGDGYEAFTRGENAYDFGPGLEQVVADYIKENGPVTPALDGRIVDLSATDAGSDDAEPEESAEAEEGTDAAEAAPAAEAGTAAAGAAQAINETVPDAPDALADAPSVEAESASGEDTAETSADETPDASEEAADAGDESTDAGEAVEAINEAAPDAPEALADAPTIEAEPAEDTAEAASEDGSDATEEEAASEDEAPADSDADAEETADAAAGSEDASEAVEAINETVPDAPDALADAPNVEANAEGAEATDETVESADETPVAADSTDGNATEAVEAINEAVPDAPDALAEAPAVEAEPSEAADAASGNEPSSDEDAVKMAAGSGDASKEAMESVEEAEAAEADEAASESEAVAAINESTEDAPDALAEPPVVQAETVAADETNAAEAAGVSDVAEQTDGAMADAADDATDEASDATDEAETMEASADAEQMAEEGEAAESEATETAEAASDEGASDDASEASMEPKGKEYTIRAGDSYWRIAAREYGDGNLFAIIEDANDKPANRLRVGDVIIIPPAPAGN